MTEWPAMSHASAILALLLSMFPLRSVAQESAALVRHPAQHSAQYSVQQRALRLGLHESQEWRRLVHYRPTLFGSWVSEADGANFFVSPRGRRDPKAELLATLEGFASPNKRDLGPWVPAQTVKCQFPARFRWLDERLGLGAFPAGGDCGEFNDFRRRAGAKSATLVFSSYYVANPSSAYGHTLLRLNRGDGAQGAERQLLDFGVNYAANPTTSNPVLYALYGLSGFFKGTFTTLPYYYKVREYADFESRDLWEYDLALSREEVDRLVEHLWELSSTHFDYYYLTENCSYHMLTLLEAAAPRLNLIDRVPLWVIPTDTLKAALQEEGLIRGIRTRPSIHTQFRARREGLGAAERGLLNGLIAADDEELGGLLDAPGAQDENSRAAVLDAYMDYIDLNHARELMSGRAGEPKHPMAARKHKVLLARSRLPSSSPLRIDSDPGSGPHMSHGSTRIMGQRVFGRNDRHSTEFAIRFALHDLLDPQTGLPDNATIEFMHLRLRHWDRDRAPRLEDFTLFEIGTFQPLDAHNREASWRVRLGAERVDDPRCRGCTAAGVRAGAGASARVSRWLGYALAEGAVLASPGFAADRVSPSVGPTLGARLAWTRDLSLMAEGTYQKTLGPAPFERRALVLRGRWLEPWRSSWALDVMLKLDSIHQETSVGFAHYF